MDSLAFEILAVIFRYRRSLEDAHEERHFCEQCNFPHIQRIQEFISKNEPIHFVLPAFPAKSPNLKKVIGKLPDLGEVVALRFLNEICNEIKTLYSAGAKITICSDGRVFNDLLRVRDDDVSAYTKEISKIISDEELINLNTFDLDHHSNFLAFDDMRSKLTSRYGYTTEQIREIIKTKPRELSTFNGIERFLIEDFLYLEPTLSKNAVRKLCHELAYRVVQRSHAWSALVSERFSNSVRLSIHPQPCHFEKIGICLVPTKDNWLTPWHGTAVKIGEKITLMKRFQAEELGAKLIYNQEKPAYFELSPADAVKNSISSADMRF
ncbi:MAG: L-tyrosine/L-tryptophan isonitrile synthase family protein [Bacteriovoracia bacterium]